MSLTKVQNEMLTGGGASSQTWTDDSANWTINGFGSVTNKTVYTIAIGKLLIVRFFFTSGTVAGTTASVQTTSVTFDNTKFSSQTAGSIVGVGSVAQTGGSATNIFSGGFAFVPFYDGSTTDRVFLAAQGQSSALVKAVGTAIANNNSPVSGIFAIATT